MGVHRAGQAQADRVEDALREPLGALGLDVEAVEVTPAGNRRVLRVAIDRDGGITLDDVADAARVVGVVLDDSDVMGEQPYTLEVTSRGVDRPLTLPRHWRRNLTRLVKVKLTDGSALTGRILTHDEDPEGGVALDVSGQQRRLGYAEIDRALVQVEFNRMATDEADEADETDEADEADELEEDH